MNAADESGNEMILEQGIELTTRRCVLRPIAARDVRRLHEIWSSPGVRRFLWDDERIPIERTQGAIEESRKMFRERSFGLWGAWSLEPANLIGFGGVWHFRDPPEFELLYGIEEPLWGKGYATEVAAAVIAYCFDTVDMPVVRASTDAANGASVRVLEKLGFLFVRRITVSGLDTVFYELPRRV